MTSLTLVLLLLLLAWFWLDSLKARDLAVLCARDSCSRTGVQLLDATVSLSRLRLARNPRGRINLTRTYRFEYSQDGTTRQIGFIRLLGHSVETIGLANDQS